MLKKKTKTKKKKTEAAMPEKRSIKPDADPLKWAKAICEHRKVTATQSEAMANVRDAAVIMIVNIIQNTKPSADRATAIRKVREGLMFANAAISLEWEGAPPDLA